jgi:STE24 endopeptidase
VTSSRLAGALLVLSLVAAGVITWLTVPFTVLPGADLQPEALRDFTPDQLAREVAFHEAIRPPAYLSLLLALAVAGVLGLTGLGARLIDRFPRPWPVRAALATAALLLIVRLVRLPLDLQAERVLRRYGLSTQDWPQWFGDVLRGQLVMTGTSVVAVLVLLGLARAMPDRWWAAGAIAAVVLAFGGSFLYPVVVEPAFNRFTPIEQGQLRTDLLAMAERVGVPVEDVLVADASRRTTALNAYVSGLGSSRRLVVYDTLLRESTPREVELVVAHELGHAKHQDVLHGTLIAALASVAGVCALFLVLRSRRILCRIGAEGAGDPRVLAFVLLLATAVPLVLAPVTNAVSRRVEQRADLHALEATGDVPTFIRGEQRLATSNLSDLEPHPLGYAFFFTHPSAPERIAFAREWQRLHR